MKRYLKIHRWWDYQLTIMMAFAYYITAAAPAAPQFLRWLSTFGLFVLACVGIAGSGHLVNDYFDLETDGLSGAPNLVSNRASGALLTKTAAIIALALLPWFWLPTTSFIVILLVLEFVLFVLYSVPRIRLKERGLLGPMADSLYSYVVSITVATLTFAKLANYQVPIWFSLVTAVWSFFLGLRQILSHQILDASRDKRAGLKTYVTVHGCQRTLFVLDSFILPVELALFLTFLCGIARNSPSALVGFVLYAVAVLFVNQNRSVWSAANPWQLPRISRLFLLNNVILFRFYTEWLPILCLIPLVRRNPAFLTIAVLHLILFNNGLKSLIGRTRDKLIEVVAAR